MSADEKKEGKWPRFKIELPGPVGIGSKVSMDGMPLHGVTDVALTAGCRRVTSLTLTFIAESIDIIADATAVQIDRVVNSEDSTDMMDDSVHYGMRWERWTEKDIARIEWCLGSARALIADRKEEKERNTQ